MIFFECIPEMERDRPGEKSESVVEKEKLAGGDGRGWVFAGRSRGDERELVERVVRRWGNTKVNKQGSSC